MNEFRDDPDQVLSNQDKEALPSSDLGLANSQPLLPYADEDLFDPYRLDDRGAEAARNSEPGDTEFGGELSPAQAVHPGLARHTLDDFKRDTEPYRVPVTASGSNDRTRTSLGWVALILAIGSLFYWPMVLGPLAAVTGVTAYFRGSKAMGVWSVVLGIVAVLASLYLLPYYS